VGIFLNRRLILSFYRELAEQALNQSIISPQSKKCGKNSQQPTLR